MTSNLVQCVDCVRRGNSECFHQPVCDAVYVEATKKDLEELIQAYNELFNDEVVEKLTLYLRPDDVFKTEDMQKIEFEPRSDDDWRLFSDKLNKKILCWAYQDRGIFPEGDFC